VARDGVADSVEVVAREPLERLHLARPAREPIGDPVRQRRGAEAAVAAGRAERDPLALQQDDALALLRRL